MMVLLLAAADDETAHRVADEITRRQPACAVWLVSPADIAAAPRWTHTLGAGATGRLGVTTTITLLDGTTIDSDELSGVFNRMRYLDLPQFARSDAADQAYAHAELRAALTSWLAGVRCPVINPATPDVLAGAPLSLLQWQLLASQAGLPAARLRLTTNLRRYPAHDLVPAFGTVDGAWDGYPTRLAIGGRHATLVQPTGAREASAVVVGDAAWGDVPPALLAASCGLARAANVTLLRVHFVSARDERGWIFAGAEPLPDVVEPEAVCALAAALAPDPGERRAAVRCDGTDA